LFHRKINQWEGKQVTAAAARYDKDMRILLLLQTDASLLIEKKTMPKGRKEIYDDNIIEKYWPG